MKFLSLMFLLTAVWLLFDGCSTLPKQEAQAKKDSVAVLMEAMASGDQNKVSETLKTSDVIARLKELDGKLDAAPPHLAAAKGQIEILRSLLDAGLPVEMKDTRWQTPLHYAVIGRQRAVISLLLERKANIDAKSSSSSFGGGGRVSAGLAEMTPLSLAANGGDVETIKLLLDHKADIDGGTNTATPLY
ncbi:MAG: ankyrin repeat domain-containing protein [Acidobacteriota bacterium]